MWISRNLIVYLCHRCQVYLCWSSEFQIPGHFRLGHWFKLLLVHPACNYGERFKQLHPHHKELVAGKKGKSRAGKEINWGNGSEVTGRHPWLLWAPQIPLPGLLSTEWAPQCAAHPISLFPPGSSLGIDVGSAQVGLCPPFPLQGWDLTSIKLFMENWANK